MSIRGEKGPKISSMKMNVKKNQRERMSKIYLYALFFCLFLYKIKISYVFVFVKKLYSFVYFTTRELVMKRLIISLFMSLCFAFTSSMVNAQEMNNENHSGWANGWKYAFSKEGMKEWKPEFTLRKTGVSFRRYWHIGKRKAFALYSDLFAGMGWIYKINCPQQYLSVRANVGDVIFVGSWQPGLRIRFYKNIHVFFGPLLASDSIGLHFGIGF